jgi:hypothetical protein
MTRPRKKPLSHSARLKELIQVAVTDKNVNLNLFIENEDWIAIEGDRASLEFLGNLLLEFAKDNGPDFLNLDSPSPFFKNGSEGIVLYRKP